MGGWAAGKKPVTFEESETEKLSLEESWVNERELFSWIFDLG